MGVRRASLVVALVVVLGTLAPAGVGAASGASGPGNDTNVSHHADPASVNSDGDLGRVEGWLSDQLTDQLQKHSVRLSEGQYEAADGLLDDSFQQRLSQYVEVSGETDGGEETADVYARIQQNQREVASAAREFESTYDEYRRARDRGDDEAAQNHARDLEQIAERVQRRADNATGGLETIETATGTDTETARERLTDVTENVTRRHTRVRQTTFTETSITAEANSSVAAFNDPVTISGRIRTSRDEPIANKDVTVVVGERAYETSTDGEGRYDVTYRPVAVSRHATAVNVTYRPADDTPYLAASTSAELSIRQVDPGVSVSVEPRTARLGTDLTVAASVSVGNRVVSDLPVTFAVAERDAGGSQANGGVATTNWTIPSDLATGDHEVRATVSTSDAAISQATETTAVTVEEMPTELSLDAEVQGDAVAIDGQLALAADGTRATLPESLPVVVSVAGKSETVQTDAEGRFSLSIQSPTLEEADGPVTVRAEFEASETNLGPSLIDRQVTVGTTDEGDLPLDGGTLAAVAGLGLVVLLVVGYLLRRWWRGRQSSALAGGDHPERTEPELDDAGMAAAASDVERTDEQWLASARTAMADGDVERAVASAYAAAHGHVTDSLGLEGVLTPRELLTAAEDDLDPEAREALATLTDVYERVIFASEASQDAGELAIYAAATVVEADVVPATEADD